MSGLLAPILLYMQQRSTEGCLRSYFWGDVLAQPDKATVPEQKKSLLSGTLKPTGQEPLETDM